MNKYQPKITEGPNGVLVEHYGEAHALRQSDAEAALEDIEWAKTRIAMKVECGDRIIATVWHTLRRDECEFVVTVASATKRITPEIHALNIEMGRKGEDRAFYGKSTFCDPLGAPDDRDLEHSCACGMLHTLDPEKLRTELTAGAKVVQVSRVLL